MLNPFPDLLTYSLLAPFILRLSVAAFLIFKHYRTALQNTPAYVTRAKAIAYTLAGVMLFLGFYTQIAVLIALLLTAYEVWQKVSKKETLTESETWCLIFMIVIGLSLMFSGAGAFAIDLPL